MELRGKAVIVTGASRGLGAALAEALGRAGARLVLISRDREALGSVVERIRAGGGEAHAVVADVSAPEAAARVAGTSGALVGPADVVIHNAGALGPIPLAPLADTSDADFEQALATNLLGPFRLTRALVGSMALRGRGTVVLVSHVTSGLPPWKFVPCIGLPARLYQTTTAPAANSGRLASSERRPRRRAIRRS